MANPTLMVVLAVIAASIAFVPLPQAEGAVTCGTVQSALMPCYNTVLYGGTPPDNCCGGIKTLYRQAATTADRQAVCQCFKSVANAVTEQMLTNAKGIMKYCRVSIPYPIDRNINCNSVH